MVLLTVGGKVRTGSESKNGIFFVKNCTKIPFRHPIPKISVLFVMYKAMYQLPIVIQSTI
jgi:hypothetical protein